MFSIIFYFFITKKKFGFYTIFYSVFWEILIKALPGKGIKNYLFYSRNVRFFYFLFLYICSVNLSGFVPEIPAEMLPFPMHISFIFFVAAFIVGVINSGSKIPRATVPFSIPPAAVPLLATIEFM
jgi:hypothetical protein